MANPAVMCNLPSMDTNSCSGVMDSNNGHFEKGSVLSKSKSLGENDVKFDRIIIKGKTEMLIAIKAAIPVKRHSFHFFSSTAF